MKYLVLACLFLASCAAPQRAPTDSTYRRVTFFHKFEDHFGSRTASGVRAREGVTVAAPKRIPIGTAISIPALRDTIGDGNFVVQDRGSAVERHDRIDVYVEAKNKREGARRIGRLGKLPSYMEVLLPKEPPPIPANPNR